MTWTHEVRAHNTATDSTNKMHDDSVAATYGFRGGLVPGVDVWAYMTRPCIDRWGAEFLERGSMTARFLLPVYDGEQVTATLGDDGALQVRGPDGTVRATGTAGLGDHEAPRELRTASLPDPVPPASEDLLDAGTVLGPLRFRHRADKARDYLASVRETSPIYESGAVCHPGFLARQANYVLAANVVLPPWIHVGTTARHRGVVRDGAELEVRAVVSSEHERKGHRFVDLDVEITADGTPVWSAEHTAIWRPRSTR